MARHTGIADALRAYGLDVVEHTGWETRGSSLFFPAGVVGHHTASRAGSDVPSLRICIEGRPDLPGPLCHVLISRSGRCHVIAAGRANHAGSGGWRGLTGNRSVFGIEVENNGVGEAWPAKLVDVFDLAAAALLKLAKADERMYSGHKEWAPGRKIDPFGLDMNEQRTRIGRILKGGTMPTPTRQQWRDLQAALAAIGADPGKVDGIPGPNTRAGLRAAIVLAGGVDPSAELQKATLKITEQQARISVLTDGIRSLATSAAALADRTITS